MLLAWRRLVDGILGTMVYTTGPTLKSETAVRSTTMAPAVQTSAVESGMCMPVNPVMSSSTNMPTMPQSISVLRPTLLRTSHEAMVPTAPTAFCPPAELQRAGVGDARLLEEKFR